jgi:K+-sensing histidine kinase KdpD
MRPYFKQMWSSITPDLYFNCLFALVTVVVTSIPLILIGKDTLGEAVIVLLYLVPVGWSAARWGQVPGFCAAVAAALAFDFFFITPFHTFIVGNLEEWLVLIIFLVVAIIVVGRIQTGLTKARESEREAIFMYELSMTLAGLRTQEAVVHVLARQLQRMFQAAVVEVSIYMEGQTSRIMAAAPANGVKTGKPDRVLPIQTSPGVLGEIRIWRGHGWLPPEDNRLLLNFATQARLSLERARSAEAEARATELWNPKVEVG